MIGASKQHLGDAGESYFQHMRFATRVGGLAVAGGLACLVHAIVPGLCRDTGSRAIRRLNAMIDERQIPN
jgi:hypothetical protein